MKRILHITLIIILFLGNIQNTLSQESSRRINPEKLETLKNDSDFQYTETYEIEENLFSRIWNWIVFKFFQFLQNAANGGPEQIIALVVIGLILAYAIIKLFGIDPTFGLLNNDKKDLFSGNGAVIDDISGIDFNKSIQEAFEAKDYREAIRLYYIFSLNQLDSANVIQWKKGKTNNDYLYEVEDKGIRENFASLNYYFEYAVYGEFDVTEKLARNSESLFDKIKTAIK